MPELPEVETVRRGLAPFMEKYHIHNVELYAQGLRFPFEKNFTHHLCKRKITTLTRRGKYLLAFLEETPKKEIVNNHIGACIMHLGMSGRFIIEPPKSEIRKTGLFYHNSQSNYNKRHIHVIFTMETGARILYHDPRRFGMMLLAPRDKTSPLGITHPVIDHLGIEPLGENFTADILNKCLINRRSSIKDILLNQRIIAGIGNIYACEALFRAGIRPRIRAHSLYRKSGAGRAIGKLYHAIRDVLQDAIRAGGSSLRDYTRADGELGYFQYSFAVYGRADKKCIREGCKGIIRRITQSGRSSFYCPRCQK